MLHVGLSNNIGNIIRALSPLSLCQTRKFQLCPNKLIPEHQILDSSKLKDFADNSFNFDENGKKLSKRLENMVGKGEIAHYEQFLLFRQCFQNG